MKQVTTYIRKEPCKIRINKRNFCQRLHIVTMSTHLMVQLMEPISQASKVDFMEITATSLVGLKSFNLVNKAATLLHLGFTSLTMDHDLCESVVGQIVFLTKMKFLEIHVWQRDNPTCYTGVQNRSSSVKGKERYCHIPRNMCPEFLRSVSHFHHLVLSGNNLTGCLSNFLADIWDILF